MVISVPFLKERRNIPFAYRSQRMCTQFIQKQRMLLRVIYPFYLFIFYFFSFVNWHIIPNPNPHIRKVKKPYCRACGNIKSIQRVKVHRRPFVVKIYIYIYIFIGSIVVNRINLAWVCDKIKNFKMKLFNFLKIDYNIYLFF